MAQKYTSENQQKPFIATCLEPWVEAGKNFAFGEKIDENKTVVKYRFFTPKVEPGKVYPFVIYLHGIGECGDDNEKQLIGLRGGTVYALPEHQAQKPCFVLVPQCPEKKAHHLADITKIYMDIINEKFAGNPVDANRIYITGVSLGGMGTWHMISQYPNFFAAAMPICGAYDPYEVRKVRNMPIWAFHAADDPAVPVGGRMRLELLTDSKIFMGSRLLVNSLRSIGNDSVHYTEYPVGYMENVMQENPHACWDPAYLDEEAYHWLFEQNRSNRYEVNFIKPGIWHLEDYFAASFYLVEGKDKALAIDTGMGKADIMPLLKSITNLPITLAITHAHGDHMYHADEFAEAYINEKENKVLPRFKSMMMADRNFDNIKYIYVDDGDIIDLGGQIELEVAEIGGHTPGSIAFIDRAHNVVFSGDALGSGVGAWMQVPFGLPLTEYRDNLRHFAAKIADIEPLVFYGGHKYQEEGHAMYGEKIYNPLCKQLISDMIELCDKLLDGEIVGTVSPMKGFDGETVYSAAYGMGSMLYIQKQLK